MIHDEYLDLAAAHALGAGAPEELARLQTHLAECPHCRQAMSDFEAAAAGLAQSASLVTPPSVIKERLLARINRGFSWQPLALAASVLIALGGALLLRPLPLEVAALTGTVHADGRLLAVGDRVSAGQQLTTAAKSTVDIKVSNWAVVRLGAESQASLERRAKGAAVRLAHGGLLSVVRPGSRYAVRTAATLASVRGTIFYVRTDSPEKTYICLCQGALHLSGVHLDKTLAATSHTGVDLKVANDGVSAHHAGMFDHTDQEVMEMRRFLP